MKFRLSFLPALLLIGVVSVTSCTKSYTCHCDFAYTNAPGLPDSTSKEFTITDTKGNAQTICRKESGVYENNNIYSIETCYLY